MSKHTPGPWAVLNGADVFTPLGTTNASGITSDDSDGWHIADCAPGSTTVDGGQLYMPFDECRANASLISAAPDLLESSLETVKALNYAYRIEPEWDNDRIYGELPSSGIAAAYFAARAAIAKATGVTP